MKKALILQSWFSTPEDNWYPWLKAELEKRGYRVMVPKLPTMDTSSPDMEAMLTHINSLNFVTEETLVIGHSLGSVLALRLAERRKFGKGILLAAWDFNDLTPEHQSFWQSLMDHTKIKENVKEWVFLISDNDPYVTKFIAHEVAARVDGKAVDVGSRGHFGKDENTKEVPEILEWV